ncbi:EF-P lysine aminoacylase GenX [Candidatus Uhrbacteria bacterium RIFOXYB2_FULL_57_15]|uniref:EF-P lysine aminoacylase GenX n=1 Tax=Candidatus Uhrbacteria bacterium RIFOXYB2_FULL_57_15 TaxID=1802422 RepID=A0A1F7W577_9BACT|nr:MAG: EF-P lysine aminoacylase GenX [Candidatus Uhrbacteria bacterium RIFOXYB2_FULL_57_15]
MQRDSKEIAKEREIVNNTIRSFFHGRGYVEVETPIVVRSPGMEPNLMPLETTILEPDGTRRAAALITSPEYSMKKLLGLGFEKIFTLAKVFRNDEELGGKHNPEFSMLEWYRQGADYVECMNETEALVRMTCSAFGRGLPAFRRVRVRDLFLERVGIDLDIATAENLRAACAAHGIHIDASDTESDLFYRLFLARVEPNLGSDPVFVFDYPIHQAALSRLTADGKYGERFELYIGGLELCNAFTELVDSNEQRRRFAIEAEERHTLGKTIFPVDEELLALLPSVRQPTFGNALGIDRLHMVATGKTLIEDVLLFPARQLFKNS